MRFLAWCLLVLCLFVSASRAQESSCLNQLVPCLEFIKSKKTPSSSCCNPLKSLIKTDPQCLCSMLGGNAAEKQQVTINVTQALLLPARCGEKLNASFCKSSTKKRTGVPSSASKFPAVNVLMISLVSLLIKTL